jgi:hypothetical protein
MGTHGGCFALDAKHAIIPALAAPRQIPRLPRHDGQRRRQHDDEGDQHPDDGRGRSGTRALAFHCLTPPRRRPAAPKRTTIQPVAFSANHGPRKALGDFQTPPALAATVLDLLRSRGPVPGTVLEPTCGIGAFVHAAMRRFADARAVAFDVNPDYVRATLAGAHARGRLTCEVANVFTRDWRATLALLPPPVLVVGNPPWVTSAGLGALESTNLPEKSNHDRRRGLDAVTGKSNFDVAEWIVTRLIDAAGDRDVTVAMLVKTSVARRVLSRLWSTGASVSGVEIFRFDAAAFFGVNADACLFVCRPGRPGPLECTVADLDRPDAVRERIGWRDGALVADPIAYDGHRGLLIPAGASQVQRWRSGVKHDCAAVMELRRDSGGRFVSRGGERVELEADYVYPLFKSTDVARERTARATRWMIVTQDRPGADTAAIASRAPKTWRYLCAHGDRLDARRSSIYRNRPRFSVFGVGPYTFAPWKVAISALHKRLAFTVVGPVDGRPAVLDDACYHLSYDSEADARAMVECLRGSPSRALESLIFWDAKRPITTGILQRLDLRLAAAAVDGSA